MIVGEPDAGKLHVRFDEGGLSRVWIVTTQSSTLLSLW